MTPSRKTITIHDVAAAAGVSVSTVSRVLNDKDDVAAETYERVKQVIVDLGYASSLAARGMRSRRTNVIGLIMPDVAGLYAAAILQGVNCAIAELDYDLLVYTPGGSRSPKHNVAIHERHFVSLLSGSITDGVIVVTPKAADFPTTAPIVAIDPNNEKPEYPTIISTNLNGAMQAMSYLTDLGHRRIGFISGRLELVSASRRLQGYRNGLAAAGIPVDETLIQIGDYSTETAVTCAHKLFALAEPPTAIFASNDQTAIGVYQAAQERGLRIPEDVSVIGFDNLRESVYLNPSLTTIDQFIPKMGSDAVEMLVKLINGATLENKLYKTQTQLVIRNSCRPL